MQLNSGRQSVDEAHIFGAHFSSTPSFRQALSCESDAICVSGSVGSGKTEWLVRKAAQLVEAGVAPGDILVLANSEDACFNLRKRIAEQGIPVLTPRAAFLRVIDQTGSGESLCRVLNNLERTLLIEDVACVAGSPAAAARSLKRIDLSLARLDSSKLDDVDNAVQTRVEEWLAIYGALLESMVAPRVIALMTSGGCSSSAGYRFVLMDDAQNLSAATQKAAKLLAREGFFVTAAEQQSLSGFDIYADASLCRVSEGDGFARFSLEHAASMPHGIAAFCRTLSRTEAKTDGIDEDEVDESAGITLVKWRTMEEESAGIAELITRSVQQDPDKNLAKLYVAVPDELWARIICDKLNTRRIRCTQRQDKDITYNLDAETIRRYAALSLARDDKDILAWRVWLHAENPTNAPALWEALRCHCAEQDCDFLTALRDCADVVDDPELSTALFDVIQSGIKARERLVGKTGFGLVKAAAGTADSRFALLCEPVEGTETVDHIHRRVTDHLMDFGFDMDGHHVLVGPYRNLVGLNPDEVYLAGMIEGVIPAGIVDDSTGDPLVARKNAAKLARYRRLVYNAAGKAAEALYVSCIQAIDVQAADRLGISVRRFRRVDGRRVAAVSPSQLMECGLSSAGNMVSGEQLLAQTSQCEDEPEIAPEDLRNFRVL